MQLRLVSHTLCPYAQRIGILLVESGMTFERVNIDLANKPAWFLAISPLGKVPVLEVNERSVLFESNVIAHYLHELSDNTLLSSDIIEKHQQLGWVEVASDLLADIARLYNANKQEQLTAAIQCIERKFLQLEQCLSEKHWFAGSTFTLVDAAFAPALRYFNVLEGLLEHRFFAHFPTIEQWRKRLLQRPSVKAAVSEAYEHELLTFFKHRDSLVGCLANERFV